MQVARNRKKTPVTLLAVSIGFALQAQAMLATAQDAAPVEEASPAPAAEDAQTLDTMVVTGYRASLERALDIKRGESGVVDAIVAEDISDFPDMNLAESLQRIPGVSITREGGEGRNISVRGLGPQFTRVRINGIEALATGGGTDTSGGVNRGRGFDFNTFASELFSQLVVRKTSSADIEEGSLGATVDLRTARPFDYDGFTLAIGGQASYNDLIEEMQPRGTFLISNTFADDKLGALLSVAYTDRTVIEEGSDSVRWSAGSANGGFGSVGGVGCADAPADPGCAAVASAYHPRIPRYNVYTHDQERLGVTASFQAKPSDATEMGIDILYARFDSNRVQDNMNAVSFSRSGNGKPDTDVLDYEIDGRNNLVYGAFDGVDIRTEGRYDEQTTNFLQYGFSLKHHFSDTLTLDALVGSSVSTYDNPVQTTIIADKFDVDGYIWDYRGNSRLPVFGYGDLDPLDPSGWTLAEIRLRPQYAKNEYDTGQVDLTWSMSPYFSLKGGVHFKDYTYTGREWRRSSESVVPAGVDLTGLMRQFGLYGIDAGGINRWVVPDVNAFADAYGIYSNNGIYAVSDALSNVAANNRVVNEESLGFYLQGDFSFDIGAVPFRGNVGVRRVDTDLTSDGWSFVDGAPVATRVKNDYSDTLPSFNLIAEVTPDFLVRLSGAKVMSRPNLGFLNPGATVTVSGGARTVNTGNPMLDPFRAKTLDLNLEWYFEAEGLLSLGLFYKDIDSYIQTSRETRPFHTSGLPDSLLAGTGATPNDDFTFQQPLNTPGGDLTGYEVSYQQPFTFLPGFWQDFGTQLNYTYVDSEIQYLSSSGEPSATGPMVGLSRDAWNATLYYDNQKFAARVSASYRSGYLNQIPGREGSDVEGTKATTTVDASLSYNINDNFSVTLEGLNLTDEWSDLWIDSAGDRPIAYTHTGRQYMVGFRYKF